MNFLYIYGVDFKIWAKKFDIEPFIAPCQDCGKLIETTLPFIYGKKFRGLAINCPCGSRVPYCLVNVHGDLFSLWR
jgi:hypothetical protein